MTSGAGKPEIEPQSDIVDRLRIVAAEAQNDYADISYSEHRMLYEAADEIDRLRRAVNRMADAAGPAWTPRWVLDAPWRQEP